MRRPGKRVLDAAVFGHTPRYEQSYRGGIVRGPLIRVSLL